MQRIPRLFHHTGGRFCFHSFKDCSSMHDILKWIISENPTNEEKSVFSRSPSESSGCLISHVSPLGPNSFLYCYVNVGCLSPFPFPFALSLSASSPTKYPIPSMSRDGEGRKGRGSGELAQQGRPKRVSPGCSRTDVSWSGS